MPTTGIMRRHAPQGGAKPKSATIEPITTERVTEPEISPRGRAWLRDMEKFFPDKLEAWEKRAREIAAGQGRRVVQVYDLETASLEGTEC